MSEWDDSGATPETPEIFNPVTYEQDTYPPSPAPAVPGSGGSGSRVPGSGGPGSGVPGSGTPDDGGWTHDERRLRPRNDRIWPDESWPPRKRPKRRPPRWVLPALAAVVGAAIAVELVVVLGGTSRHTPHAGATATSKALATKTPRPKVTAPALTPAITPASAEVVLAAYTGTVNRADAAFSPALLGTADGQGSYSLIASDYKQQVAARAKPTAAYAPQSAQIYIPLESAAYPHWFAVRVVNATTGSKPKTLDAQYLVFLQSAPGTGWKQVDQPYTLGTSPNIALSAAGYATAVSPTAKGFAVIPDQMPAATASSLDGHGGIPVPGNLADASTAAAWRHNSPKGTAVTLTHAPAGYPVFGLETTGGGALLFYTDSAQLTAAPPKRKTLSLQIPGYYSGKQRLKGAALAFVDQFAAYDPPVTIPGLSIIAADSGIVS